MQRPERRLWLLVLALCLLGAAPSPDPVERAKIARLAGSLMCTCGCPHIINQCGDECPVAPKLIQEITAYVRAGKSEQEVRDLFEAKYGPAIHATPKAEGFNLLAWVAPFIGLLMGAVLVVVVVRSLRAPPRQEPDGGPVKIDPRYRKLLDRELEE